jgi:hypothetical protein
VRYVNFPSGDGTGSHASLDGWWPFPGWTKKMDSGAGKSGKGQKKAQSYSILGKVCRSV